MHRLSAGALSRASRIRWCGSASSSKPGASLERSLAQRSGAQSARRRHDDRSSRAAPPPSAMRSRPARSSCRLESCIVVLVATVGLAQRSLYTHVRDVLRPLARDDLPAAREAVSRIVGPRYDAADVVGCRCRRNRKPRGKLQRRHRRAGVLARDRRTAGIVRVQGAEHRRQSHRSSRAALARVRLGGCARRRPGQSHSRAARGTADRPRRRRRIARDVARRASATHRRTRAGRKRRWRAHSASSSAARRPMKA